MTVLFNLAIRGMGSLEGFASFPSRNIDSHDDCVADSVPMDAVLRFIGCILHDAVSYIRAVYRRSVSVHA